MRNKNGQFVKGHHSNLEKEFKKGLIPWNKNLTKENSKILKRMAEARIGNKNPAYKIGIERIREKNPNWKGGIITDNQNYRKIKISNHPNADKNGYVKEHIFIMSQKMGRPLKKGETVHHINENRIDNRIDNLYLFKTRREHSSYTQNLYKTYYRAIKSEYARIA